MRPKLLQTALYSGLALTSLAMGNPEISENKGYVQQTVDYCAESQKSLWRSSPELDIYKFVVDGKTVLVKDFGGKNGSFKGGSVDDLVHVEAGRSYGVWNGRDEKVEGDLDDSMLGKVLSAAGKLKN